MGVKNSKSNDYIIHRKRKHPLYQSTI